MMGPRRGDTICGNVAIEALGPMHFGALALGPVHLARSPSEPSMWLATVERTLVPRSVDVSRFMAGVGELAARRITGAVPLVLVDREADFCVVGYRAIEGARTVATIAESGVDAGAAATLARQLAQTLAELHRVGAVHGLLTPTTVIHDGARWWTWEYGIAGLCAPDRLAPRLRPLGGDAVAPELRAGGEVSAASDVYGWGTAVACLLTGGTGSDAVVMLQDSDANDPLTELCRAALESIPELRPRNGDVLLSRLAEALGPADVAADVADAAPRRDATEHARFALPEDPPSTRAGSDAQASDSGEFSFAELNEGHASASPTPVGAPDSSEIVELLVLGPDESVDDDDEPASPTFTHPSTGPDTSERWRELAEEYLSEAEREAHRQKAVSERLATPPLEVVSPTDRRSVEALGRVALVRTRVRTGPHKPTTPEHVAVSGSFEMSSDPVAEPQTPPRAADGARELPLGTPEDEAEWDDPDAAVFDLDAPGAPRVGGGHAPDDDELDTQDVDPPPPRGFVPGERHSPWSEPTPVDGLGSRRALPDRANDDTPALSPLVARRPPAPSMAAPTPASGAKIVVPQRAAPNVSVPNVSVPNVSVPNVSVPNVSVPNRAASAPSNAASWVSAADAAVPEIGDTQRPAPESSRLELDRPVPTGPRRATPRPGDSVSRPPAPALSVDVAPQPRLPLGEAPPMSASRARPTAESGARDPSRPTPTVDRPPLAPIRAELTPPVALRERSGRWVGGTVAVLAGVIAIGATLAAARQKGGLSRLLEDRAAPEAVDAPAQAAPVAGPQAAAAAAPTSCPETMRVIGDTRVCIDEAEAPGLREIPRTRVSLDDARAECAQRGARLCTAVQWRAACRGPRNWRYPYGSRPEVDRCNGASASGQPQNLSRTGARDGCVTQAGVFDLVGNVGEWVDDGSVLGGDSATRAPSCDTRSRAAAGSTSASTGYRCCLDLGDGG